jgi:molecular chaperone DnaK
MSDQPDAPPSPTSAAGPLLYAGFDLGTSNSAAAVFDGNAVTVVRNAAGASVTPSVVRIDKAGRVTVGARARRLLDSDPANTASEFKRLMGTGKRVDFPAAGERRLPEQLSAEVLRALREDARAQLGVDIARAVISVPALFELPQASATSEAARLAGFDRVELVPEPVASALAAGWRADADQDAAWLVYDLGGGTFDASLLETRDGLLRVIGHDGDNFLGGRDLDWAITEHLIAQIAAAEGVTLSRKDPAHASALRVLRAAAEEAKIELSRAQAAPLVLSAPLRVGDRELTPDLELTREQLERLCLPLIDRSIEVCRRLLREHGHGGGALARIVLVGGPTMMPLIRRRVGEALGAPIAEGLDPMTLVAQGAAIFAATAGLDARSAALTVPPRAAPGAADVWLQHPAVSADLTPHVVGRFVGDVARRPRALRLVRTDGGWTGPEVDVDADGTFVATASLRPRAVATFRIEARRDDGQPVPVAPDEFTIVQGVTIGDPPLARTIGVALASDHVQVYLERGVPLPARRTFTHRTVETIAQGSGESVLHIPIVQGEFARAHLCRLVGSLTLSGAALRATVPTGSEVEVTIELDRGGRMTARALIPAIGQVFEQVIHLLVPEATPAALDLALAEMRPRIATLRADAFRGGNTAIISKLGMIESRLADAERDIDAAHGGDADSAQKARRTLLEIDAVLAEADLAAKWPEVERESREVAIHASSAVSSFGTEAERRLLDEVMAAMARARTAHDAPELERQVRLARRLTTAAIERTPDTWVHYFEHAAAEATRASDVAAAQRLVGQGKQAIARGDHDELRRVVRALWNLLPDSDEARRAGFDSGVR